MSDLGTQCPAETESQETCRVRTEHNASALYGTAPWLRTVDAKTNSELTPRRLGNSAVLP